MTMRHAGFPEAYLVPSVSTSAHISHSTDSFSLNLQGRNFIGIAMDDQTALTANLGVYMTDASGATEARIFFDGNRWIGLAQLPNGLGTAEKGNTMSLPSLPGDQSIQLYCNSFTSASGSGPLFTITAENRINPLDFQYAFGLDGGNPSGSTSESPGSLSVGGKDFTSTKVHRTASFDSVGRAIVRPWGPGDWSVGALSLGTTALAQRAAGGAGVRHVCTSITATLSVGSIAAPVASPGVILILTDGAVTTLWATQMSVPAAAGSYSNIVLTDLNIRGSANTTMSVGFVSASGTSIAQTVYMTGIDVTE